MYTYSEDYTTNTMHSTVVSRYNGSDSAIKSFYETVGRLNNRAGDYIGTILISGYHFVDMAVTLRRANSTLAAGWEEVAELLKKVDNKLQEVLESLILEMNRYAESSNSGELEAINAVKNSNSVTNELLNELNGI